MGEDIDDELAFWKARITDIKVDSKRRVSLNLRGGISSSPVPFKLYLGIVWYYNAADVAPLNIPPARGL
jgi:hypothetical protein